jgi:hypothetical protein
MFWSLCPWYVQHVVFVGREDLTTAEPPEKSKDFDAGGCSQFVANDIVGRVRVGLVPVFKIPMDVFKSDSFRRTRLDTEAASKAPREAGES